MSEEEYARSKKPDWDDGWWTVEAIIDRIKTGEIDYWRKIQRRARAWTAQRSQDYIRDTINGIRPGTNITLVDMERCRRWNKLRGNSADKNVFSNAIKEVKEKQISEGRDPTFVHAIAEGNHRTQALIAFINNEFKLPKGTVLHSEELNEETLEKATHFKDLEKTFQRCLLNTKIPITQITGATIGQVQTMVTSINSSVQFGRAELRQLFPASIPSDWALSMDEKYYETLENKVCAALLNEGRLMTYCSRMLYWTQHGCACRIPLRDDALDQYHKTDLKQRPSIDQSIYDNAESFIADMVEILSLPDKPLIANRNSNGKASVTVDEVYTLSLAIMALDDIDTHPNCLSIAEHKHKEYIDWLLGEIKILKKTIVPSTEKTSYDFSEHSKFVQYQRKHSFALWDNFAVGTEVDDKYKALQKVTKRDYRMLINKGILKIKNKTYFSGRQKDLMKKRQNYLDPITEEELLGNAEGHHIVRQEFGGLTILENGVMLNKPTHDYITHSSAFMNTSWQTVLENKSIINAELKRSALPAQDPLVLEE